MRGVHVCAIALRERIHRQARPRSAGLETNTSRSPPMRSPEAGLVFIG